MTVFDFWNQKRNIKKFFKPFFLLEDKLFTGRCDMRFRVCDPVFAFISSDCGTIGKLLNEFKKEYEAFEEIVDVLFEADKSNVTTFADQLIIELALNCCRLFLNDIHDSFNEIKEANTDNLELYQQEVLNEFLLRTQTKLDELNICIKNLIKKAA